jgi:hypothetical protein
MNFGRISTSKCQGKLQKKGVLYTHSSKSLGPFPQLPNYYFLNKKISKKWVQPWAAGRCLSLLGCTHFS